MYLEKGIITINKDKVAAELLLISILLFTIGQFCLPNYPPLFYLFKLTGIVLFISLFFRKKWILPFNSYADIIYLFFIGTIFFLLLRPILHLDLSGYKGQFYDPYYFWGHALPFILLTGIHNLSLEVFRKYIIIYSIIGIGVFIADFKSIFVDNTALNFLEYQEYLTLIGRSITFLTGGMIILLTPHIFSKKIKTLSVVCFFLVLFIQAFAARRGSIVLMSLFTIFSLYLFCDRKYGRIVKYFILVLSLLFLSLVLYSVADYFTLLLSRLGDDTRSGVEYYLLKDLAQNFTDWIVGRGVGGTYYCPIGNSDVIPLNRGIIETGYLYYILKGGIIYLFSYVLILLIAFFKGFFFSKNFFCKGLSLFILYNLISLYPFGLPGFTFSALTLWISVVWCMKNSFLRKTDDEIWVQFNNKHDKR